MAKENLDKIVATPKEVTLDGKKELLHPLRFKEWGQLEKWMRTQIISAAVESIEKDMSQETVSLIMSSAHASASKVSILQAMRASLTGDEGALAYLRSFEGMFRAVQLSLRVDETDEAKLKYTYSELDKKLSGDIGALSDLFMEVLDLSFPGTFEAVKNVAKTK
jgi:hypothetical protein